MSDARCDAEAAPQIDVSPLSVEPAGDGECWKVTWQVTGRSAEPVELRSARLPHGQFKAEELRFDPAMVLAPGKPRQFDTRVRCVEPPGPVTENAFVIFHASWRGGSWRIYVRVRVVVDAQGKPGSVVESITTQRVGFSGVAD